MKEQKLSSLHAKIWGVHEFNGSSVVEILKMLGPKMEDFYPRIDMLKESCFKTILQWIMVCPKVSKSYFQSQVSMSKMTEFF